MEFDGQGLFDNLPHPLLLKAVRKHVQDKWAVLYIERWLTAPMELEDGTRLARDRGTPQGGCVSPVLANLFMHYCFDAWMQREYPELRWCRYADDGLIHCRTLKEAEQLKLALQRRLAECGLEMPPDKTSIVYCMDGRRTGKYPHTSFDFLGYTFRPRGVKTDKCKRLLVGFNPAVSQASLKQMRQRVKALKLRRRTQTELTTIAALLNPMLRGWMQYYGRYRPTELSPLYHYVNLTLMKWARRKYKRLRGSQTQAAAFIAAMYGRMPRLFAHCHLTTYGARV